MTKIADILSLRPARAADRDPAVAWCDTLWDGQPDYIRSTWDHWQAEGNLLVGVEPPADDPLALLRMRQLSPGEAWFGGLRIHPRLQGRGVGRQLIAFAVEWARARGARTLGYMTETSNARMHHLGAALGFGRPGGIIWHDLAPAGAPAAEIERDPGRIDLGLAANLRAQGGLYFTGWAVQRLDRARLDRHAAAGQLVALSGGQAWAIIEEQAPDLLYVSHAEGGADDLRALLAWAARARPGAGLSSPLWEGTPHLALARELGWRPTGEAYSIFERPV
ncbi:MAG TPA: GNAT family N-acetyltransferase [Herpetosiphonaceae bacterium]|nr:GNAT family N-acetyltransferase [Herpetosiphonaceae bacterium]